MASGKKPSAERQSSSGTKSVFIQRLQSSNSLRKGFETSSLDKVK